MLEDLVKVWKNRVMLRWITTTVLAIGIMTVAHNLWDSSPKVAAEPQRTQLADPSPYDVTWAYRDDAQRLFMLGGDQNWHPDGSHYCRALRTVNGKPDFFVAHAKESEACNPDNWIVQLSSDPLNTGCVSWDWLDRQVGVGLRLHLNAGTTCVILQAQDVCGRKGWTTIGPGCQPADPKLIAQSVQRFNSTWRYLAQAPVCEHYYTTCPPKKPRTPDVAAAASGGTRTSL